MISYYLNNINYDHAYRYINYYLVCLHVPQHYYHIFTNTNMIYEHLIILLLFTGVSYILTPNLIMWIEFYNGNDKLSKYIGGLLLSHIYLNLISLF
jgi:hypothetical protein